MKLESTETISTDVLIIGGGGAGLRAAIEAKEHDVDVLLVSKSRIGYGSNTTISGGGFAAVLGPAKGGGGPDSGEQHLRDTIVGGYFISDQRLAETMVIAAGQQVEDLSRFGVKYTSIQTSPWIELSIDPGHRYPRLIYGQNAYGTDFTLPMRQYAVRSGVRFLEGILVTRLLKKGHRVVGAMGIDAHGRVFVLAAAVVVLAGGGLGQIYRRNDNAAGVTGDGYALAYEAGAVMQDMEFVQFYPTGLGTGNQALFYECFLLDTGGKLLNSQGEDIVAKHGLGTPMLLTRDRVSLAIAKEAASGRGGEGGVILDLTEVSAEKMELLRPILPRAVSGEKRRFPVAPVAHFHMGGVKINEKAETSVPGLYAAGEVCSGIHGANRLSGNALTEVWVFGSIAGREAARKVKEMDRQSLPGDVTGAERHRLQEIASRRKGETPGVLRQSLQETMWAGAGIVRSGQGLRQAIRHIEDLRERHAAVAATSARDVLRVIELGNMLTVAEMVCRSALYRTESRGAHYRQDYPRPDSDHWLGNVSLRREKDVMALSTGPVKLTRVQPEA